MGGATAYIPPRRRVPALPLVSANTTTASQVWALRAASTLSNPLWRIGT
jgi:hypothetical protein